MKRSSPVLSPWPRSFARVTGRGPAGYAGEGQDSALDDSDAHGSPPFAYINTNNEWVASRSIWSR